mgnify:CR=1 FL=1
MSDNIQEQDMEGILSSIKGILEENLNNNFNPEYHNKIQEIYITKQNKKF